MFYCYLNFFCLLFTLKSSRYVAITEREPGIEFTWPDGDKSLVQIDHASVVPENTQVETVTMYKLLILLEKVKKVTAFKVSYTAPVSVKRPVRAPAIPSRSFSPSRTSTSVWAKVARQ